MSRPGVDDVFFPQTVTLELGGEQILLPTFSLSREHRVRLLMTRAFDSMGKADQLAMAANFFTISVLSRFFLYHPTIWILLGAETFGKPVKWVRQHTTMAEILSIVVPLIIPPQSKKDQSPKARGPVWTFARIIEFLIHEYKWTLAQVLEHSQAQIQALMAACSERYEEQNAASKGKKPKNSRYARHPRNQPAVAEPAGLGDDGGVSSLRSFARRNNMVIKKS